MTLKDEIIELSKPFEPRIRSAISSCPSKDERCGSLSRYFGDIIALTSLHKFKGCTYRFNGKIYEEISKEDINLSIFDAMEEYGVSDADINSRGSVLLSKSLREKSRKELVPSKRMLVFGNGVLDIDTGILSKYDREIHVLNMVPYNYDTSAECPMWLRFLSKVLPEPESRMVLQEYLGLIFVDRNKTSLEKMLILFGNGANGKSVVFNTIKGILGEANISFTPIEDLVGGKSPENMATVDGKLLNYNSELGKKELNGKKVKALISGEPTPARQLYKDPYVAKNIPLMMANANALPDTQDDSKGFFRRFLVLTFNVEIKERDQDHNLATKLKSEYSGIFNWIIQGRQRMIENDFKFTESENARQSSEDYESQANAALIFLKESRFFSTPRYLGHEPCKLLQKDIFRDLCIFCSENHFGTFSSRSFRQKMVQRGFTHRGTPSGNYFLVYKAPMDYLIKGIVESGKTNLSEVEFAKFCGYDGYVCLEQDSSAVEVEDKKELEINFEADECP